MPLADFECPQCGKHMERLYGIHDYPDNFMHCFECGAKMYRIMSKPNFTVKGHSAKNLYHSRPETHTDET